MTNSMYLYQLICLDISISSQAASTVGISSSAGGDEEENVFAQEILREDPQQPVESSSIKISVTMPTRQR